MRQILLLSPFNLGGNRCLKRWVAQGPTASSWQRRPVTQKDRLQSLSPQPLCCLPTTAFFTRGYHSSFSIFEETAHLLLHTYRRGNGNVEWKGQTVMERQISIPLQGIWLQAQLCPDTHPGVSMCGKWEREGRLGLSIAMDLAIGKAYTILGEEDT